MTNSNSPLTMYRNLKISLLIAKIILVHSDINDTINGHLMKNNVDQANKQMEKKKT